jgi:polysaccharide export outer membrane protein
MFGVGGKRAKGSRLRIAGLILAAGASALAGGCADSYMDPSVSGRWEATPTSMPILNRIATIEADTGEFVEVTDPVPEDLIPLPVTYRLGPGDALEVTLYDLIVPNQPETYEVQIDARGNIELPQLGRLSVAGKTSEQATDVIKEAMRRLVSDPLALVVPRAQRQQTFNIVGAVESPGPYFIPKADYRLLEAITAGGVFDESIPEVFVIRQVTLTDDALGTGDVGSGVSPASPDAAPTPVPGKDLIDLIDEVAGPEKKEEKKEEPKEGTPPGSPGAFATRDRQPEKTPAVDLVEQDAPTSAEPPEQAPARSDSTWVFLNGKWVQLSRQPSTDTTPAPAGQPIITQRVIRISLGELLSGKQSINIVIRPGDVVRVPAPPAGLVYVGGQVARPGPYQLPSTGGLTLLRAINAAGGYGGIAIPSRIDLTRMVGKDRQATIMLNGVAIAEQTQPDIYIKPNDIINVGTNFWALPLAVIRNGFRASYGFGFVFDKNFADEVFDVRVVQ